MDFKGSLFSFVATVLIVIQRIVLLVLSPYKTMRRISAERDYSHIIVIFLFIFCYFFWANTLREYTYEPFVLFLLTIFHYIASVVFFYSLSRIFNMNTQTTLNPFLFTIAYTYIPTIIWFSVNSALFAVLPPPRTFSTLGTAFSIVFISFSVAVLLWKLMVEYLAVRFASHLPFYRIMYSFILYVAVVGPYFFWMYVMKFFRIPFI